jgi:hypothetical protein
LQNKPISHFWVEAHYRSQIDLRLNYLLRSTPSRLNGFWYTLPDHYHRLAAKNYVWGKGKICSDYVCHYTFTLNRFNRHPCTMMNEL